MLLYNANDDGNTIPMTVISSSDWHVDIVFRYRDIQRYSYRTLEQVLANQILNSAIFASSPKSFPTGSITLHVSWPDSNIWAFATAGS